MGSLAMYKPLQANIHNSYTHTTHTICCDSCKLIHYAAVSNSINISIHHSARRDGRSLTLFASYFNLYTLRARAVVIVMDMFRDMKKHTLTQVGVGQQSLVTTLQQNLS